VVRGGGTIDLTVRQGRVEGFGGVPIEVCDGTTRAWQADVTTFGERDGQPVTLRVDLRDQLVVIQR
jgi:hypothetical protein